MHRTSLRKVGDEVMLAVPQAILDLLDLRAGTRVGIGVEDGRLIIKPKVRPGYSLEELLAECDGTGTLSAGDRAWIDARPVGRELL